MKDEAHLNEGSLDQNQEVKLRRSKRVKVKTSFGPDFLNYMLEIEI